VICSSAAPCRGSAGGVTWAAADAGGGGGLVSAGGAGVVAGGGAGVVADSGAGAGGGPTMNCCERNRIKKDSANANRIRPCSDGSLGSMRFGLGPASYAAEWDRHSRPKRPRPCGVVSLLTRADRNVCPPCGRQPGTSRWGRSRQDKRGDSAATAPPPSNFLARDRTSGSPLPRTPSRWDRTCRTRGRPARSPVDKTR